MKTTTVVRIAALSFAAATLAISMLWPSEHYIMSKSLKLTSERGSCSAEQIKAPSGVNYVLTAGHCRILETPLGEIMVETEDGRKLSRKVIAEDADNDLLLLEGVPGLEGLDIATKSESLNAVRTFTHGKGMKTYKTEGAIIQGMRISIPVSPIESEADEAKCVAFPKNRVINMNFIFGLSKICVMEIDVDAMTASVVPGSSGGMVVDSDGKLVGVVSATDGVFGYAVPLKDIRRFTRNY